MVYVDNKVALRQLELANIELLSRTSMRSFDGTSLAKDGKFHPRVLTLVRLSDLSTFGSASPADNREGWRSYYHTSLASRCSENIRSSQCDSFRQSSRSVKPNMQSLTMMIHEY